jgi:hypothetical protein
MNRAGKAVAVALGFGVIACGSVAAQSSGGPYQIQSAVVAGGGGPIAGGTYQITGTFGQPATTILTGAGYTIFGGFWGPVGGFQVDSIFANDFDAN